MFTSFSRLQFLAMAMMAIETSAFVTPAAQAVRSVSETSGIASSNQQLASLVEKSLAQQQKGLRPLSMRNDRDSIFSQFASFSEPKKNSNGSNNSKSSSSSTANKGKNSSHSSSVGPLQMMKDGGDLFFANAIGGFESSSTKSSSKIGLKSYSSSGVAPLQMFMKQHADDFVSSLHLPSMNNPFEKSSTEIYSHSHELEYSPKHVNKDGPGHASSSSPFPHKLWFKNHDEEGNIDDMEKEVRASAQAKLDIKTVKNAIFYNGATSASSSSSGSDSGSDNDNLPKAAALVIIEDEGKIITAPDTSISNSALAKLESSSTASTTTSPPSQWQVAFAAGSINAFIALFLFQMPVLSFGVFLLTSYVASRDPSEDEDLLEGDISGPVSRIVGRATLESIEKSKPTIGRVARAVVEGDVVEELQVRNVMLRDENNSLKGEVARRTAIETQSKYYTVANLKDIARKDGLKVGGTKAQLMMRLLENESIPMKIAEEQAAGMAQHYTVAKLKAMAKNEGVKVSGTKKQLLTRLLENGSIPLSVATQNE